MNVTLKSAGWLKEETPGLRTDDSRVESQPPRLGASTLGMKIPDGPTAIMLGQTSNNMNEGKFLDCEISEYSSDAFASAG